MDTSNKFFNSTFVVSDSSLEEMPTRSKQPCQITVSVSNVFVALSGLYLPKAQGYNRLSINLHVI